jgi:hypothetical protein
MISSFFGAHGKRLQPTFAGVRNPLGIDAGAARHHHLSVKKKRNV